ncbi:isochorismatase family protein [Stenotrophomonas sp. 24(2023)]|uniref:isochorismatase family protein n=1 Tax=Stenotrophomonas sp. 24(2023) TaxID=3068324 RepID=UPI0027E19300|nr:isochorismatase family protein [Stenotrophomonas sp. 24(2023)]WMJ69073.1 isochorismatase family protein [Stenotrophomonas sp. 24(2023)]
MPLSQLDPRTALIVIDLQAGVVAMPTARPAADIVAHASALAQAFRAQALPVVLVNVTGIAPGRADASPPFAPPPGWSDLVPELDAQPSDHRVSKQRWGAFTGTDLHALLQAAGVTQVVLCGISTSIGIESTARHAHELGYNVVLVEDAMTDRIAQAHANSVQVIFPRVGEVTDTASVLQALQAR